MMTPNTLSGIIEVFILKGSGLNKDGYLDLDRTAIPNFHNYINNKSEFQIQSSCGLLSPYGLKINPLEIYEIIEDLRKNKDIKNIINIILLLELLNIHIDFLHGDSVYLRELTRVILSKDEFKKFFIDTKEYLKKMYYNVFYNTLVISTKRKPIKCDAPFSRINYLHEYKISIEDLHYINNVAPSRLFNSIGDFIVYNNFTDLYIQHKSFLNTVNDYNILFLLTYMDNQSCENTLKDIFLKSFLIMDTDVEKFLYLHETVEKFCNDIIIKDLDKIWNINNIDERFLTAKDVLSNLNSLTDIYNVYVFKNYDEEGYPREIYPTTCSTAIKHTILQSDIISLLAEIITIINPDIGEYQPSSKTTEMKIELDSFVDMRNTFCQKLTARVIVPESKYLLFVNKGIINKVQLNEYTINLLTNALTHIVTNMIIKTTVYGITDSLLSGDTINFEYGFIKQSPCNINIVVMKNSNDYKYDISGLINEIRRLIFFFKMITK